MGCLLMALIPPITATAKKMQNRKQKGCFAIIGSAFHDTPVGKTGKFKSIFYHTFNARATVQFDFLGLARAVGTAFSGSSGQMCLG